MNKKATILKHLFLIFLSISLFSCDDDDNGIDDSFYKNFITSFNVTDGVETFPIFIDYSADSVFTTLPNGIDLKNISASVCVSEGATVTPDPSTIKDWSNIVKLKVTSLKGEEREYSVTLFEGEAEEKTSRNLINTFYLNDGTNTYPLFINNVNNTIYSTLPYGVDLSNINSSVNISEGATISPDPSTITDWSEIKTLSVTSKDGEVREYSVEVALAEEGDGNNGSQEKIFTGNISLRSQYEVDALGALKYTKIVGRLEISGGSEVLDLSALSSLKEVTFSLFINGSVNNLNGLDNLESVGDLDLDGMSGMEGMDGLKNIDALKNLKEVNGRFGLMGISGIVNLDVFSNLEKIGGRIWISENTNLVDFNGIKEALASHTGEFHCLMNGYNPTKEDILNGNGAKVD